jgi:hypothetical protein
MTPTALKLAGGIGAYLAPRLAMDQKMPPISPMVRDVTRANFGHKKHQVAARIRYAMKGKVAMDADLDDLVDLLDALEEIGESEAMEPDPTQDRRRGRARDIDPNGFGGSSLGGGEAPTSYYGVNPNAMTDAPLDCTDPEEWERQHGRGSGGLDQEELDPDDDGYWREEDDEERRRQQIAGSTGSQSLDDRIKANADRKRRAGDKRKATLDQMRKIIRDALSARDDPPDFPGMQPVGAGAPRPAHNSVLEPGAPPPDIRANDRMAHDAALNSRSRMYANMRRMTNTGVAYSPSNVGGSAPNVGGGPVSGFARRYPWASRVKV